jgi:hypothetical protein
VHLWSASYYFVKSDMNHGFITHLFSITQHASVFSVNLSKFRDNLIWVSFGTQETHKNFG